MAEETKTNSVEQATPVAGKPVTPRLSDQLTGVHSTFSLLLEEIKANNKTSNGLTLGQLKYEREIAVTDGDKREEQLDNVIKGLKEINVTLKGIKSTTGGKLSGSPVEGKESSTSKGLPKEAENITFTEGLKSFVGGAKSIGNKFMKGGGNVVGAVTDTLSDPGAALKKAYGSTKDVIKGTLGTAKDILSTKADYSVEQERFATAFSKTGRGGLMQGKKTGKEVGADVFNKLKAKQEEIDKQKAVLKPLEEQGFTPVGEKKKLAKLQKELADMDPRVKEEDKKDKVKQVVQKKQEDEVTADKLLDKKDKIESKVSSKAEQDPSEVSAPSDSEDLLKEIQNNNVILGSLLAVTQTQLIEIKAIKQALAPSTPKELTEQKSAPSSTNEKEAVGGGSLIGDLAGAAGDLIGRGKGKAAGKAAGMGGKILGGLGKAAKFLGPAAAIAGATYSGVEGYQNTNENFDLKEGDEATTGQKISSTLGGVVSGATLGLLDGKTASQGIHKAGEFIGDTASKVMDTASKAGSAVKGLFGFGDKSAPVTPSPAPTPGSTVAQTSTENADMTREASSKAGGSGATIVSNNVSSNNTTKIVPMKANPRPEYTGSSLDRYTNRITVY